MRSTTKNTTVKDAAKFFWGKKEFEIALKTEHENAQSEICMLSESFATNGSFMIYGPGALEFEPVHVHGGVEGRDQVGVHAGGLPQVQGGRRGGPVR